MVTLVPPGEQVSFFIPVFVKVDGKSRPGGLLYTDKHVIVGYTEGAMRLSTSYARAISLAAITSSPMSKEEIGPFAPKSPSPFIRPSSRSTRSSTRLEPTDRSSRRRPAYCPALQPWISAPRARPKA